MRMIGLHIITNAIITYKDVLLLSELMSYFSLELRNRIDC